MGNWLKGRVLINDTSLITDSTQQPNQVVGSASNYQVSSYTIPICVCVYENLILVKMI